MGSKAAQVWKFVVPVIPCASVKRMYSSCSRNKRDSATYTKSSVVDIHTLQEEIASVGARVHHIDEQIETIKAALPELDSKIRYACVGMPMSSLSLEELQDLKGIHFKLLRFWEELSRKQLEKLGFLSDCLQILEERRRAGAKSKAGEEAVEYQDFEQKIVSEKVESNLRKNQELEMKLYLDRISRVPDDSKPALVLQTPPERGFVHDNGIQTSMNGRSKENVHKFATNRSQHSTTEKTLTIPPGAHDVKQFNGPQRVSSEQTGFGEKNINEQKMLLEVEKRINEKLGASTPSSSPGHQWNPKPSTARRCKDGVSAPSSPALRPVQMPSSIKV